jgi:hypothetical protein
LVKLQEQLKVIIIIGFRVLAADELVAFCVVKSSLPLSVARAPASLMSLWFSESLPQMSL